MPKDYYDVLGVPRSSSEKEIRTAFRKLARKHHPDVNPGQAEAAERFKEINEAHEVLSDPEKRRLYDRFGHNWKQVQGFGGQPGAGATTGPFRRQTWPPGAGASEDLFGEFGLGDIFDRFFSRGRGGPGAATRRRSRSAAVEHPVTLSLEEAHDGATRSIQVTGQAPCAQCGGTGVVSGAACRSCLGQGFTYRPTRGEVTIPPGVEDGSRVRVNAGGQAVILVVSIRPNPRFQRKGTDLYTDVEVPLYNAVLGGEVVVPTLKGRVALTMPPETPNGRVFRLTGQGMPRLGSPQDKGTLYVTVKVVLPTGLTEEEREHFQGLKDLRKR